MSPSATANHERLIDVGPVAGSLEQRIDDDSRSVHEYFGLDRHEVGDQLGDEMSTVE
jgi:hypothetical protein